MALVFSELWGFADGFAGTEVAGVQMIIGQSYTHI